MKNKLYRSAQNLFKTICKTLILGTFCFGPPAIADDLPIKSPSRFDSQWQRATDSELNALRGGFKLSNGTVLNISIDRMIFINDSLTSSTALQFPDNFVLQNGIQNLAPSLTESNLTTIIQNNVDNQTIRAVNTINIELSNLSSLRQNLAARTVRDFVLRQ